MSGSNSLTAHLISVKLHIHYPQKSVGNSQLFPAVLLVMLLLPQGSRHEVRLCEQPLTRRIQSPFGSPMRGASRMKMQARGEYQRERK